MLAPPPQSCDVEVLVGRGRGGWEDQGRDDANACAAIVGVGTADPKRSECAGPAGEPKLATLTFIEYPAIDYLSIFANSVTHQIVKKHI